MEPQLCEAISKKTYLPCKLQAKHGLNVCGHHKDFFNETWKDYFLFQRTKPLYVIYQRNIPNNLETIANEKKIGLHIRKVLQNKLVTIHQEDLLNIPVHDSMLDLYLYILECDYLDLLDVPQIIAILISRYLNYSSPKVYIKQVLDQKIQPVMENKFFNFSEKMIIILTAVREYVEEEEYFTGIHGFPDFTILFDHCFKYYDRSLNTTEKKELLDMFVPDKDPKIVKIFEEILYPRLTNLE